MTFVITQPCIDTMDQSCVEVCPVDCIHFEDGTDRMLYINPAECIDCGACQPACPVSAIFPESDVPADQQHFTEINSLWYEDPEAARSRVGGGAPAPAAAEAAAPAAAPAASAESPVASGNGGTPEPAPATERTAAPATEAAPATAAAAAAAATAVAEPATNGRVHEVPAGPPMAAPGAEAPALSQMPSPVSVVAAAVVAVCYYVMWVFPGPEWLTIAGVGIGASVVVLLPVSLIAAAVFVREEAKRLSRFAARHERRVDPWRAANREQIRRSEESRRFYLERIIQEIAAARFQYPSPAEPTLRTYVNVPEPQLAVELGPGGEKLLPDIVVTRNPGNYPVMIVQVETRETTTREQAHYVWKRLENRTAPLYLYVPAGLAAKAQDYIKDVGITNVRLRTWRRIAGFGVQVTEV